MRCVIQDEDAAGASIITNIMVQCSEYVAMVSDNHIIFLKYTSRFCLYLFRPIHYAAGPRAPGSRGAKLELSAWLGVYDGCCCRAS